MQKNPLRKFVQTFGIDLHRYHEETGIFSQFLYMNIGTIIDIGANVGQFAHEIRDTLPQAQIFSFEPIRECFDKLVVSFARDDKFKAYNMALGSDALSMNMNKSSYTPSSSLLPMAKIHKELFPHTQDQTPEQISVKRLDDVFAGQDLEKEILIKIDVQGYEDKVIDGGMETFKKAKAAIIETSFQAFYEGQPLFDDIYRQMISLSFSYHSSIHQKKDKKTGEILFEDSVFIKE